MKDFIIAMIEGAIMGVLLVIFVIGIILLVS